MNIREASCLTGLSARVIRHYESSELVEPSERSQKGYRRFDEEDITRLLFIRNARQFGFSLEAIRSILSLRATFTGGMRDADRLAANGVKVTKEREAALREPREILEALLGGSGHHAPACRLMTLLDSKTFPLPCAIDDAARQPTGAASSGRLKTTRQPGGNSAWCDPARRLAGLVGLQVQVERHHLLRANALPEELAGRGEHQQDRRDARCHQQAGRDSGRQP